MSGFRHNLVPELYILDNDHQKSSSYLTDKDLDRNIKNTVKLLGSCILHLNGIKKSMVYQQYSIEKLREMFKDYPDDKLPTPKFSAKPEYKYVRQCMNHYMYIIKIGKSACVEYEKRYNRKHKLEDVLDWYFMNVPTVLPSVKTPLPYPIKILPLKYRTTLDIAVAMRRYYIDRYRQIAMDVYKRTSVPEWFNLSECDVMKDRD